MAMNPLLSMLMGGQGGQQPGLDFASLLNLPQAQNAPGDMSPAVMQQIAGGPQPGQAPGGQLQPVNPTGIPMPPSQGAQQGMPFLFGQGAQNPANAALTQPSPERGSLDPMQNPQMKIAGIVQKLMDPQQRQQVAQQMAQVMPAPSIESLQQMGQQPQFQLPPMPTGRRIY